MSLKLALEQFKKETVKADGEFSFSLFPILFANLQEKGLDQSIITEEFISDFKDVLLPGINSSTMLRAIACINYYKGILQAPAKEKKQPVAQAVVVRVNKVQGETPVSVAGRLEVSDSPNEEGSLHTPESERLNIKPEDLPDMQYDWDIIQFLGGAVGVKK